MAKKDNIFTAKWSERGPAERVLLIVAGTSLTVASIVAINRLIKTIKERRISQQQEKDIDTLQNKGQKASYLPTQYTIWADYLYECMEGIGTYRPEFASVIYKMKNDIDVLRLNEAFGKKDGYTLSQWIAGDFSAEDKDFYINSILRKKGIKFQF